MKPRKARTPHPNPDALRSVTIEKAIYGGSFLARLEGKALFVPLTLPGEQLRVRIVEEKRSFANAEIEEIVTPASERIAPLCPHFAVCGGCNYQHTDYPQQLSFKQAILRETLERGGVQVPLSIDVLAGEPWRYRNRVRLAFDAQGNVGYRGRRSHAITPIRECPIAAPLLVQSALAIADILRSATPAVRPSELSLFCNADASSLLASLFFAHPATIRIDDLARAVQERIPALTGMELIVEDRNGRDARLLGRWGREHLVYPAAGFGYRVDTGAFFQVNRWLVDALVERVTAGRRGALAWDLFAGVGLFAKRLTESFARVVAVESAPAAIPGLTANLAGAGGTALRSDTLQFLRRSNSAEIPDLIVVDPPRAGLGADITSHLAAIASPEIVYVSCDPATLARDLQALAASGYSIGSITLVDLFPQTFHLETVVALRRS